MEPADNSAIGQYRSVLLSGFSQYLAARLAATPQASHSRSANGRLNAGRSHPADGEAPMSFMKRALSTASVAALIATGTIAATTGIASARVVCNAEGDCWHTDQNYRYGPDVHAQYHPDSWYFHNDWDHDQNHHWRGHHEGRGYWHSGVWVTL
jgi:hypothetical protein